MYKTQRPESNTIPVVQPEAARKFRRGVGADVPTDWSRHLPTEREANTPLAPGQKSYHPS